MSPRFYIPQNLYIPSMTYLYVSSIWLAGSAAIIASSKYESRAGTNCLLSDLWNKKKTKRKWEWWRLSSFLSSFLPQEQHYLFLFAQSFFKYFIWQFKFIWQSKWFIFSAEERKKKEENYRSGMKYLNRLRLNRTVLSFSEKKLVNHRTL